MPNDKVATPVVDKNGKQTTVHKKVYVAPKNRVANIVAPLSVPIPNRFEERDELRAQRIEEATVGTDHEWTRKYRVPVVHGLGSNTYFIATLAAPEENIWGSDYLEATDDEAALIGSYIQYRMSDYYESYQAASRKQPLDIDSGVNTTGFAKLERGWIYNKATWRGQPFAPRIDEEQYSNLMDLIDRMESFAGRPNERWSEWKTKNGLI